MKRIAIVLPYFTAGGGDFPAYFQFFLNSCADNPTIDWLIYTDDVFLFEAPDNVHVHKCSFEWFRNRLQGLFDFEITLDKPYKLCDYKPAYGQALEEDLRSYDYWGHCDCDLIFGNIRRFIPDELLANNEKVFSRGHFSLYKNNGEINSFYKSGGYYKTVFTSPAAFAFDEWGGGKGISSMFQDSRRTMYDDLPYDDIKSRWDGFHLTKSYKGAYHQQNDLSLIKKYAPMKYIWYEYHGGRLIRKCLRKGVVNDEEVLYAHFQKRPLTLAFDAKNSSFEDYMIVPDRIIPFEEWDKPNLIRRRLKDSETLRNCLFERQQDFYPFYRKYIRPLINKQI